LLCLARVVSASDGGAEGRPGGEKRTRWLWLVDKRRLCSCSSRLMGQVKLTGTTARRAGRYMVGAAGGRAARVTCWVREHGARKPARPGRRHRGGGSRRLGNAIGEANPEELSYTASSARVSPRLPLTISLAKPWVCFWLLVERGGCGSPNRARTGGVLSPEDAILVTQSMRG
jgi:hypothetical protein